MRNVIAIQRGLILVPDAAAAAAAVAHDSAQLAASLQAELMNLGFVLDGPAFTAASKAPRDWLVAYHGEVIPHLRKQLGADRSYEPFYRNFPAQVMAMSDVELFVNAFVHYLSDGTWEPPQVLSDRGFAFENVQFKPVRLGTEEDLQGTFAKLVSINGSLTEQDKATVAWLVDTYGVALPMPGAIPFKETLCMLAAKGLDVPVKTPTDVLRIAVHLSGGDISLPSVPKPPRKKESPTGVVGWLLGQARFHEQTFKAQLVAREAFKFKRFRRPQRRLILTLLEKTNPDAAEMQRHLGRWLRLGEILHLGEHAARFPRSAEAFQKLRNQRKGTKVRTFAARADLAFAGDWRKGVDLLATRPGEFARRLDWMLRTFERGYVLGAFDRVAADVSSKVLFELYNHFAQRYKQGGPRVVMLKGRGAKMKTLPPLPAMDRDVVQQVGNAILAVIRRRVAALPPLGKVWVDERLKQVPVPFAMRSVNTAVRTYVRGTRVPFRPDAQVVRPFIHWFDEDGSQDLDLSVGFYDGALKAMGHISFTELKLEPFNSCHSGDVRHRKGPCAEYVDVDVAQCLGRGVRYAVVQVFNYNARPMHTVKDCVFGLMEREHSRANEAFVPKTIANCTRLANEGTCVVVCVLDLAAANYIWADVESQRVLPTLENAQNRTAEVLAALVHGTKMSVYELLTLHANARGTPVADPAEADLALRWDEFVTDYANVGRFMTF